MSWLFILGFRKAGSSTVYDLLSDSKSFNLSSWGKESQVCCFNSDIFASKLETLAGSFDSGQKINLDAPTLGFYSHDWLTNLIKIKDNLKILIVLRNPCDRSYSAFLHNQKRIPSAERRSFRSILEKLPDNVSFEKLRSAETKINSKALQDSEIYPEHIDYQPLLNRYDANLEDMSLNHLAQFDYFSSCFYSHWFDQVRQYFDGDRYFLCSLENIVVDFKDFLKSIEEWLNIDLKESPNLKKSNPSSLIPDKYRRGIAFLKKLGLRNVPQGDALKRFLGKEPISISDSERIKLKKIFQSEYEFWLNERPDLVQNWSW